ncbi:MAG: sodium:solute symporter family protein [Planctomycetota bacterium]
MTAVDWMCLAGYLAILIAIGTLQKKKAAGGVEDYFVSGRRLPWYLAGTSMIAASFASDTPLLVSGLVRSRGIWGNWQWWGFATSTLLAVFFFARLWRRTGVVTDVELTELRYSGKSAATLRGFKAVYWGVLFNCFATGAWSLVGMTKVLGAMTGIDSRTAILLSAVLGGAYAIVSGLWGIVATDAFQFVMAVGGAVTVAILAVHAAGGMGAVLAASAMPPSRLDILPTGDSGALAYCLPFLLIQWWAWKNTDGSGVLIQRMNACKNESEAVKATLWYSIGHYALRTWPWIIAGLATLVLVPNSALPIVNGMPDPEAAYPILLRTVVPAGLRGLILAWFFAEFMSAMAQAMNWGGSVLVTDLYKRFIRPASLPAHDLRVARLATLVIMAGAILTAFLSPSITKSFDFVLKATSAIGVVYILRWVWWRVNAWSEMSALVMGPLMTFWLTGKILPALGYATDNPVAGILVTVGGGIFVVLIVTFLTSPDDETRLMEFYRRVRPPGPGWRRIARLCPETKSDLPLGRIFALWIAGTAMVYSLMGGVGMTLLGRPGGWPLLAAGTMLLLLILRHLRNADSHP